MENYSMEKSSHIPLTPLPEKIHIKTSVCFLITNTMSKQWAKFITCSPSLGTVGD